jgi:hypothetical protein
VRDEKAANFCAEFVPVPWCNTKGDALLSLPKMSCYVTPGADGRAWWVLVSEFSMTGILSTLPVRTPDALMPHEAPRRKRARAQLA